MRDPNRLDNFYQELCTIHKESYPDWRFGQFCSNFFSWMYGEKSMDPFFPEDDLMLKYLKEYGKKDWYK